MFTVAELRRIELFPPAQSAWGLRRCKLSHHLHS
jgi:hypothetical protein